MHKKTPILYGALLLTAVNLILRLVSTSFQVYLSAKIGASGIGVLQLVLSVGSLALIAGIAGMRTATMYLTAGELGRKRPENVGHILSCCLRYSMLCSLTAASVLYFTAPALSARWVGEPSCCNAIRTYACFLPVSCLTGVMIGYFTAANRIGTLAVVEIAEQFVTMAVTMLLLSLWSKDDPAKATQAVICGSGIGACLTLTLLTILRLAERSPKGQPFPVTKKLLDTAVPLALADDLKAGINTTENIMVPKRLARYPGSSNPMALFGTVCGMVFPVLMFPAAIVFSLAELLIPEMARCHAAGSKLRIQYLAKRSLRIVLLYSAAFSGLLFLSAEPLCIKLYSNHQAGRFLALYAPLAPMLYCDAIIDAMNKGLGQQKICVRYNILTASMDVLFLFLLLPRYGMGGYFFSFLITHLINFILSLGLLLKTSEIQISLRMPVFTAVSLITAILLVRRLVSPFICCLVFLVVFFCLLVLLGILKKEDWLWMRGLLRPRHKM